MSAQDNEDLIDYEDEHDIPSGFPATATNGAASSARAVEGDDKDKKNFSGIHSTGFRYVVLSLIFSVPFADSCPGISC